MANGIVNKVGISTPKNNSIDLSHNILTTFDFFKGKVLLCEEMLPSDKFSVNLNSYVRVHPMSAPVYGDMKVTTCSFFVPNRILWKDWNTFITGGQNGQLSKIVPQISISNLITKYKNLKDNNKNVEAKLVRDFLVDMGIPSQCFDISWSAINVQNISELPFRAVRRCWFDWLRDQNLIGSDVEDTYIFMDGNSHIDQRIDSWNGPGDLYHPYSVPFEKDFFTTLFLEPQRGQDSFAPISLVSSSINPGIQASQASQAVRADIDSYGNPSRVGVGSLPSNANDIIGVLKYNDLRMSHALQHYLERNNIAGANAIQQLLAHWGTAPSPKVFNMSEYINSTDSMLNCDEVTSIADTSSAALGDTTTKFNGTIHHEASYTANEHGYFIVLQFARPVVGYYQGLDRKLTRFDRFDYFTPEFEATGFQPVYLDELYYKPSSVLTSRTVFGYAPRYSEYKWRQNRVSGDMTLPDSKNYHFNRDMKTMIDNGLEHINTAFTSCYAPVASNAADFDRVFADGNQDFDHFLQVCRVKFSASRPMRGFSIPVIDEIAGSDTTLPYAGVRL